MNEQQIIVVGAVFVIVCITIAVIGLIWYLIWLNKKMKSIGDKIYKMYHYKE